VTVKIELRLSAVGEIEIELDESLPCGDDMVRAERLQVSVFPHTKWCGVLKSAAHPMNKVALD